MRDATHTTDSRVRLVVRRARGSESGARDHFYPQNSVTIRSQREDEITVRESRAKRSRGAARDLSRAFAGAASRLSADTKKHEL